MPIKGQALNQSYFTSIFESDKYQNCTLEVVRTSNVGVFGINATKSEIKWIIKIQDNKLYFKQTISTKGLVKEPDIVTTWYLEDAGNGNVKLYEKDGDGEWVYKPGYTLGFYNGLVAISEVSEYTPFFDQLHYDPSLFNKTDYGFEVSEENGREYFISSYVWKEMSRNLRQQKVGSVYDEDVEVKKMYAEFFVQEGALTGVKMNSDVNFTMNVEGVDVTYKYSSTYVAKITDYGTTVVESPVN